MFPNCRQKIHYIKEMHVISMSMNTFSWYLEIKGIQNTGIHDGKKLFYDINDISVWEE